jgi:hypothetical protein
MLTVRMRQIHPGIARIGIEHGPTGWKAYRAWMLKSENTPSGEVLAEANLILGNLQKHFEIVDRR